MPRAEQSGFFRWGADVFTTKAAAEAGMAATLVNEADNFGEVCGPDGAVYAITVTVKLARLR